MNIQNKDNSFPDENFHGQLKYSTGTGMNLLLSNQIGNTTVNVRKATDVSIEGVTQLEHGQVQLHVSSLGKTKGTYKFVKSTADFDLEGSVALNDQLRLDLQLNVSL